MNDRIDGPKVSWPIVVGAFLISCGIACLVYTFQDPLLGTGSMKWTSARQVLFGISGCLLAMGAGISNLYVGRRLERAVFWTTIVCVPIGCVIIIATVVLMHTMRSP